MRHENVRLPPSRLRDVLEARGKGLRVLHLPAEVLDALNAERVTEIFLKCMFKEDEIVDGKPVKEMIEVQGVTMRVGLCKERVDEHAAEIAGLCDELPDGFRDGWSFLQMCEDRHGRQWTGFHKVMQELAVLGCATGKMELCAPKEMWGLMPGGMPYYRRK